MVAILGSDGLRRSAVLGAAAVLGTSRVRLLRPAAVGPALGLLSGLVVNGYEEASAKPSFSPASRMARAAIVLYEAAPG